MKKMVLVTFVGVLASSLHTMEPAGRSGAATPSKQSHQIQGSGGAAAPSHASSIHTVADEGSTQQTIDGIIEALKKGHLTIVVEVPEHPRED